MSFIVELSREIAEMSDNVDRVWKFSVAEAFSRTVYRTPVKTGYARNGWLYGEDVTDRIGDTPLRMNASMVPKAGGQVFLYNNVDYIQYLEKGTSAQAPHGMVSVTVNEWDTIVRSNSNV